MADFFPKREAELVDWLKNFSQVITENVTAWAIPADVASGLATKVTAYETAFLAATGENGTKALVIEKNEKRDALKAEVRTIKNKFIDYNDAVTDPNREKLGLPLRDKIPTPRPRPTSRPQLEVRPTNNRQHTVTALNQEGKKTKPADAHGVSFASAILNHPPVNADAIGHSFFRMKTSEVFDYNEEDRGKKVYYAACYENAKGETGPWSDIVEAIVP
jgi:hypothetical protein